MSNDVLSLEYELAEIDKRKSAILNLGKQLHLIGGVYEWFDIFLFGALNRTVNISKAYCDLIRSNNFLAAAPLVRINMDTLLRLFASILTDYDRNEFAKHIIGGKQVKEMCYKGSKKKLLDKHLHEDLAKVDGKDWVSKIYSVGSSYVHLEQVHILSAFRLRESDERVAEMLIGLNDSFIPYEQKIGSAFYMNRIIDSIVEQAMLWMYEKAEKYKFDLTSLNK